MNQRLIVLSGWPMSGKTTIARGLHQASGIHWIDADDVLVQFFGKPNPKPVTAEEMKQDSDAVGRTYQLLLFGAEKNLEMGRSIIISAPFSRAVGWTNLSAILVKFPDVEMKAIWCCPSADDAAEVQKRLNQREFGVNCWSTVNTEDRYEAGRSKFEPLTVPHLKLDTSPPNTPEESIQQALEYAGI